MAPVNPANTLRKRYLQFLVYYCITANAGKDDEQEQITEHYYYFQEQVAHYRSDAYISTAVAIFLTAGKLNAPYSLAFEEIERWRLRCLSTATLNSYAGDWEAIPVELLRDDNTTKYKFIRRYFAALAMLLVLAEKILFAYPLSGEAINIRTAVAAELPAPEPAAVPVQVIARRTDFPQEMNAKEAAEFLATTTEALYQLTSQRKVPHYKRGRKLVFLLSELTRWQLTKVLTHEELDTISANHLYLDGALTKRR